MVRLACCLFMFCIVATPSSAQEDCIVLKSDNPLATISGETFSKEGVTYVVKSKLNLNEKVARLGKNSVIRMEGGSINNGTLFLKAKSSVIGWKGSQGGAENLMIQVGGSDVTITDFRWCNKGIALLSYADCDRLTVDHCTISSASNNSVKLVADHVDGVIEDVKFVNSSFSFKRMGIELQNHGNSQYRYNGVLIENCDFAVIDSPHYGFAISLSGYGRNARVNKCRIARAVAGVELAGFSHVTIHNNFFNGISSKAVVASNSRIMNDIEIKGNEFNHPTAKIQLSNADKVLMSDNKMNLSYIEMIGCSDCKVVGNSIKSSGHYALIIDGGKRKAKNNLIQGNAVSQGQNNWAVFRCYGENCSLNQFVGNQVTRHGKKGVLFDQKKGAKGNTLR